jgi:hypothetical protein
MSPAIRIELLDWPAAREGATRVRTIVFVDEQGVPPEIELDDFDAVSDHALAIDASGEAIGTGRLLPDGHIGRMAVLKERRGRGIGDALLEALIRRAGDHGLPEVVLNAQTHAAPFYARHGFRAHGPEFEEAGIPHVEMRRALRPSPPGLG